MGLDMYMHKYNKKIDKDMLSKVENLTNETYIDFAKRLVNDGQSLSNEEILKEYFSDKIDNLKHSKPDELNGLLEEDEAIEFEEFRNKRIEIEKVKLLEEFKMAYEEALKTLNDIEKYKEILDGLEDTEIAYWRKHSDLNGLMEKIYHLKEGYEQEFNCVPLFLDKEDIITIIKLHKDHLSGVLEIEESRGFFWGETQREDWEESLKDFERILEETDFENETLYYSCWW